jgi:hypothetical protein
MMQATHGIKPIADKINMHGSHEKKTKLSMGNKQ